MQIIKLTRDKITMVDDEDFKQLNAHKWCCSPNGYAIREITIGVKQTTTEWMHRVIMQTPTGMETDHIDGNKLNNQRINLRIVTRSQNMMNSSLRKSNTVGFKGVSFRKDICKYRARLRINQKCINLGCFNTAIETAKAYNEAALKLFGEFAKLNIIP